MALQPIKKIRNIAADQITDGAINTAKIADGAINTAKIANTTITSDKLDYKTYFKARLTASQTDLADNATYTVDFFNNGTVDYDTANGWVGDWNAWVAPADGIYQFSYSVGQTRADNTKRDYLVSLLESDTNGANWQEIHTTARRYYDGAGDAAAGYLGATTIHSVQANRAYRVDAYCNTGNSSNWTIAYTGSQMIGGTSSADDGSVLTTFSIIRIY